MEIRIGYPAARATAVKVYPHFARLLPDSELLPDIETIEAMIDVAFWASLRKEETWSPKVSLAFAGPAHVTLPMAFERPLPFAPQPLTRLGPAVERPGIHLCVWRRDRELTVWGATRNLPQSCFVLEVVAPGLLVVKHSRGEASGKFVNVAVLQGDEIKIIDQHTVAPDCPEFLGSLLGLQTDVESPDNVNEGSADVLIQLAVSMRAHGRGGSLLVVPAGSNSWPESVLHPVAYSVAPPFGALADLMRDHPGDRQRRRWQEAQSRVVEGMAGLTAVDGATVITDTYELLAFGAKIVRRKGWEQVSQVMVTEPIRGTTPLIAEPGQLGGTRHLSAAQFAHDQHDTIALVASQDGRFTVFGWSSCNQMVYANRIEALLL